MTARNAFAVVIAASLAFAAIGGLIGFLLGTLLPAYYRSVFIHGRDPDFDPVAVGTGLGITQGFVGGAILGVLLVAVLSWFQSRTNSVGQDDNLKKKALAKAKRFLLSLTFLLLPFLLFGPYAWFVFDSPASGRIVTLRLDEEHRRAHLASFWLLTFAPFVIGCFGTSFFLFVRAVKRAKQHRIAESESISGND
jgi:hypothetical protein